ncbi:hypothetical protein BDZ94DRAFT_1292664 [Collybia nuda]|uniref:Uncharacterized protein n=1 Tax=Collybia nuda TaxID=64659 RepID=A0A9P6C928_9AGAR|nr:hypothetical protein BDZ94DRAFT_1292664 [Collybia nuda]
MSTQYSHGYGMRPPQGWVPPYQGGAPPIPPGVNVNPQQWQLGVWAFNPAYNMQRPPAQHVPWIAGQAWRPPNQRPPGQQPQQPANFNPYKKVIKPPSAEYLSEPLRENPLGLTGMIPLEDPYGEAGLVASTPWIWNPASLDPDDSERPNGDNRTTAAGHHPDPSRVRQSSEPVMSSARPDGRESRTNRHPTDPTSNGRGGMGSSSTSQSSSTSRTSLETVHPFDRPKNPEYYRRLGYADGYQPPASNVRTESVPPPAPPAPPEPESFTSKLELKPTFSPNIVRTPNQYWSQSSRSSSAAGSRENSQGSMDSLSSRMERMGTSSSAPHATPLSRHSSSSSFTSSISDSSSSISGVSSFVDEPASILSPLMGATPKPSTRPIERHHTYPDVGRDPILSTIAESPPRNRATPTPHHRQQRYTPPDSYEPYSSSPSRRSSRSPKQTPPRDGSRSVIPPPANGSNSTLYLPPNPLVANPLPPPPREVRYLPISPPPRVGPPPANRKRVRKGFWNRRGDHLTTTGYIVYAPPDQADPEDLKDYPEAGDAYKDNFGTIVEHNPNRPELPESLPRYGKPPEQPYSSFLQYDFAP